MEPSPLTLFLAGDVMTGRGIDQILRRPSPPELHESYVTDAREYVRLAEHASGVIPRGVAPDYIWGDALGVWKRVAPAARIVNLETSVTRSDDYEPKGINYRMHPDNVGCLRAAGVDLCILANNHVLDYGSSGLLETIETLHDAGIGTAGAGRNDDEAGRFAVHALPGGSRLLVAACGHRSSGVTDDWAALPDDCGVNVVADLDEATAERVAAPLVAARVSGDITIVSIHWGDNWGYDVPRPQVAFAHRLVESGIDVVFGHSSHHIRPIEVYRRRLILYGCGDFINDYEGISGYERYRDDLVTMFFPSIDLGTGALVHLRITPMQIRRFRLHHVSGADARWLTDTVNHIGGAHADLLADGTLMIPG